MTPDPTPAAGGPRASTLALLPAIAPLAVLAALAVLAWVAVLPDPARAASIRTDYVRAWNAFQELDNDIEAARLRHNWNNLARRFERVYERDPAGPYAPKALYFLGRTYEKLGTYSGLDKDFRESTRWYQKMVDQFSWHPWADDCLYRKGLLELQRLEDLDAAFDSLRACVDNYSQGDMRPQALALLREMGRKVPAPEATEAVEAAKVAPPEDETERAESTDVNGIARLETVRYRSSDEYTRVVLDLDEGVPYKYQHLDPRADADKPHRLYVDLQNTRLGASIHNSIDIADGILRRIRSGQHDPGTARVVLDFHEMQKYHIFALENPYRVVIDVYAPAGDESGQDASAGRTLAQGQPQTSHTPRPEPEPETGNFTPPKGSEDHVGSLVEQLGLKIQTIMLDPGHGGKDPGARGNGLYEKDINLKLARRLGAKLKAKGFKVLYTRTDDVFIPLDERTAMANVQKADMFVSLHCNAHTLKRLSGVETYSLNLASSDDAVRVAARENSVSAKRISDLQFILTDLMLNSKVKESKDLAEQIHVNVVGDLRKSWKVNDHGTREAPFYVLMGAKMPAVLVEVGYVTNADEAARLKSETYLDRLANGIMKGVLNYKKNIERYASL